MAKIDYSQYGGSVINPDAVDYSQYGGQVVTTPQSQTQPSVHLPGGMDIASGLISAFLPKKYGDLVKQLPYAALGAQPDTAANIAQGIGQYGPAGEVGATMDAGRLIPNALKELPAVGKYLSGLASRSGTGVAMNALGSGDPSLSGAGESAAINALGGPLIGKAIDSTVGLGAKAPKALIDLLGKYAIPSVSKDLTEGLNVSLSDATNKEALNRAIANHENAKQETNNNWNAVKSYGLAADYEPSISYNDASYKKTLESKKNAIQQENKQSALARQNQGVSELLEGYKNDPHGTFSDALTHAQALNADFRNNIPGGEERSVPFEIINHAKAALESNIRENIEKNGLEDVLGSAWDKARESTKDLHDTFYKLETPSGKTKVSSLSNYIKNNYENSDPENFVKDYLPKPKTSSISKFQQFGKIVGDEDFGKSVIKRNYFQVDNPKEMAIENFLGKYEKLQPEEREYLFNTKENQSLDTLMKIKQNNPGAMKSYLIDDQWQDIKPMLFGAMSSHNALEGAFTGKLAATAARGLGRAGVNKLVANPGIRDALIERLANPNLKTPERNLASMSPDFSGLVGKYYKRNK